jgi:hypothetical protein
VQPVAAATRYRLELSADDGATWTAVGTGAEPVFAVDGLADGRKVHLRAVALNDRHESAPGAEYPLYVTSAPPPPPDGLRVSLAEGAAQLSWGEILGASGYRLYARTAPDGEFRELHRGEARGFTDRRAGIRPCDALPSAAPAARGPAVVDYCVTAVNGNGESARSRIANTDPASWRNWDPRPGERFRRVTSFPPDVAAAPGEPDRYYP